MERACDLAGCPQIGSPKGCPLSELGVGCRGSVLGVFAEEGLRRRLLEMGFTGGTRVEVVRRAPLGDPVELRIRDYCVSLRDEQARCIKVAAEGPSSRV